MEGYCDFNPRSLAGATGSSALANHGKDISIHAPSRERLLKCQGDSMINANFNPRSLAGATDDDGAYIDDDGISIHAPSRERL